MITLARFITIAILSLLITSCSFNFDSGITGNGNVVIEDRDADETFTEIKASQGLSVYVTQSESSSIEVEADENIISLISTDIRNGVLSIHTEKNIGRCESKKIYVSLPELEKITASSGAYIDLTDLIVMENIEFNSSSGAHIKAEVEATNVTCSASSGANIKISGTADSLVADASSGSDIQARDLDVKDCNASASSGADVTVTVSDKLVAKGSSGGDVHYYGNPESVSKNTSVSGGIHKE